MNPQMDEFSGFVPLLPDPFAGGLWRLLPNQALPQGLQPYTVQTAIAQNFNWQQLLLEGLAGAAAVGGILIGVWMMAGAPKPEVIPIPA